MKFSKISISSSVEFSTLFFRSYHNGLSTVTAFMVLPVAHLFTTKWLTFSFRESSKGHRIQTWHCVCINHCSDLVCCSWHRQSNLFKYTAHKCEIWRHIKLSLLSDGCFNLIQNTTWLYFQMMTGVTSCCWKKLMMKVLTRNADIFSLTAFMTKPRHQKSAWLTGKWKFVLH